MKYNVPVMIREAISALKKGNLPQADIISRFLINNIGVRHTVLYEILAHISCHVRRYDVALQYIQSAIDIDPSCESAISIREDVRRLLKQTRHYKNSGNSYLLIKAWGYGFWSDIDHVLGQLLVAEITGRIPVVYWSAASLFSDGSSRNAFDIYFEPLSDISIDDLIRPEFSYFPPKWSHSNLYQDNVNKFSGKYARMAGLYYLNRSEDVLVSDFHTYVYDLMHWIPSGNYLYGQDCESIYRYLYAKYLRVNPGIRDEIERFGENNLAGRDCLAVHVRGSDKRLESNDLASINDFYHNTIGEYLNRESNLTIFLLTDYKPYLAEYNARYPGRIVSTQCTRADGDRGVHYQFQEDKVRNGIEVLKDACLAARCKYFIGNGRSNVSTSILHMKDWGKQNYTLLDNNFLYETNLFLHNW